MSAATPCSAWPQRPLLRAGVVAPDSTPARVAALDEQRALRSTLGRFATGVAIVTARDGEGPPWGLTINSFASISLDPPLVQWSLAAAAASRPVFQRAAFHAINVLAASQGALARRFSARDVDRFAGVPLRNGPHGAVLIEGALAHFVGRVCARREIGDHLVFVSEVRHHRIGPGEPLVFYAGRYWTPGRPVDVASAPARTSESALLSSP